MESIIFLDFFYPSSQKETKKTAQIKQTTKTTPTTSNQNKWSSYLDPSYFKVVYKIVTQGKAKVVNLYIQDIQTGKKELIQTLSDVRLDRVHAIVSDHHNVYVVRFIQTSNDWREELWRYSSDTPHGAKLYSYKGLDYSIAPNEKYIAITVKDQLIIIDYFGKLLKKLPISKFQMKEEESWMELLSWSDDGYYLWGDMFNATDKYSFFKLNTVGWKIENYDASKLPLSSDFALNGNNGLLVYSNYPTLLDIDSYNKFMKSKTKITLYVYNLNNGYQKIISSSIIKKFQPKWMNYNTVEFNNPSGENRVTYTVEQTVDYIGAR